MKAHMSLAQRENALLDKQIVNIYWVPTLGGFCGKGPSSTAEPELILLLQGARCSHCEHHHHHILSAYHLSRNV